jgi:type I restriction-modification system DNA methylase subunit
VSQISQEKKKKLENKLEEIYHTIRSRFKTFETFQKVVSDSAGFSSQDLRDEQAPEEFVKRFIIEPLFDLMGFEIIAETSLTSPTGRKEPDYLIRPKKQKEPMFYVEAEPINTDLYSKDHGVSQIKDCLISKASKTEYGMATDGFQWAVLKFNATSLRSSPFLNVDLRPVFLRILNSHRFVSQTEIEKICEDFLKLDCEYLPLFLSNYLEKIEKDREKITKSFYNDYVKYVFGFDEKGEPVKGVYLLTKVVSPPQTTREDVNLFSVVFMNRIIFVKFLEEKGIVPKNLLKKLHKDYETSGALGTFYEIYLKPLFYEVFNKDRQSRISRVRSNPLYDQIPYLNGGLFREVIRSENEYNIENEGVELILESLEPYGFGSETGINPDILGYIFEKTINFISGTGTNQQKMQGAYYTPDDVVEFIIEQTLIPIVFRKLLESLKESGWNDSDLKGYSKIEDLLKPENIPRNPIHVRKMIEAIDEIRVLDPACGSGHFLTATLSQILRVKESLLVSIGENVQRYKLKKDIVSKNLFGVDIDENAIEIARLRLWLSIIEEVKEQEHIETLPNIDFNIVSGNSLIGLLNESLLTHPLVSLLDDPNFQKALDLLHQPYQNKIDRVKNLLGKMRLEDTIAAYENLLEIYRLESGESAVRIREVLEKIRRKLYEVVDKSYLDFLHERSDLGKNEYDVVCKNLATRTTFHWRIGFGNVAINSGFDVVIGNPPYIEDNNYSEVDLSIIRCHEKSRKVKKRAKEPLFYDSGNCGNTHAYFTERAMKLLKQNGRFGFIIPISLVSTDRMCDIRRFVHGYSSKVNYYNFDDRPGKIFSGLEHCRSTILIAQRGSGVKRVTTSKYHRWHTSDRSRLFNNLKTAEWDTEGPTAIVPKIGTEAENKILRKLVRESDRKTIGDFIEKDGTTIWYHNAPQYWIHAHIEDYVPKVEYYESYKENKITGENIPLNLKDKRMSDQYISLTTSSDAAAIVNALLNSSLFYWWFVIWSDGRHLLSQHINNFPINISRFPDKLKDRLTELVSELMESYDKNSNTKINLRSGGYVIKIKEIIPSRSKGIIDKIDDVFAEYFEFDDEEKEFVRKFDIEFRTTS